MSTGIGKHEFSTNHKSIWNPDEAICPYCKYEHCEADHVDVGIGLVQCGPYHCPVCEASEISSLDKRELSDREKETGWFEPGSPVSDVANTVNGQLVNHREAKAMYDIGLLDVKKSEVIMTVTHLNTLYRVTLLACGYKWLLTDVNNSRNTLSMNRQQMQIAGFGHLTEMKA